MTTQWPPALFSVSVYAVAVPVCVTTNVPSMFPRLLTVAPATAVNVSGTSNMILPSAGMGLDVVNVTSMSVSSPAISD